MSGPLTIGRGKDADVEPDGASGLRPSLHVEVLDRFALSDEGLNVTALVAEAMAAVVAPDEEVAAGTPDGFARRVTQDFFSGAVPKRDLAVRGDGESPGTRQGQRLVETVSLILAQGSPPPRSLGNPRAAGSRPGHSRPRRRGDHDEHQHGGHEERNGRRDRHGLPAPPVLPCIRLKGSADGFGKP